MNLLLSLTLLGSLALARGCSPPGPGATNIARNGEASQISDFQYYVMGYAKNAIDGVRDTDYHKGYCTHTPAVRDPWWKVNLKQIYKISNVVLTNRGDCCKERLLGAEVRIGNSPDNKNPVCGAVTDVSSLTLSFCCNGMEGQYVSVVIPGRAEPLSLCEVEVYGDPVEGDTKEYKVCW
ncbi:fucolectin-4-like [Leptodactylus fuscus]|uniref:fucolectin-4-like n=1 Tax=Leptodactylus fuscus TaxID=238119 RepID=UPI003F4EF882